MARLYLQHTALASSHPLTIDLVTSVCVRTTKHSLLRHFVLDVLAQNFSDPTRVKGTLEEWDHALQAHSDARLLLLRSFRENGSKTSRVQQKGYCYTYPPLVHTGPADVLSATADVEPTPVEGQVTPETKSDVKEECPES